MERITEYRSSIMYYADDRSLWRRWLSENFLTAKEVWFVLPNLSSGEKGITYNDAVEEALCFGWIDGVAGHTDDDHSLRRFTPRRKGSTYSRANIERLIWLDGQGMLHPSVREEVSDMVHAPYVFPQDILDELRKDMAVWDNFSAFTEPYKRIRVGYIDAARHRPEEFRKRLDNFIEKTRQNKLIVGYGGIDKYYH